MKNTTKLASAFLACLLAANGCKKETPPRSIRLELPESITSKDATRILVQIRDQAGRLHEGDAELDFEVAPSDLAEVDPSGLLSCKKGGNGKVSLSIAGVTGTTDVRCRIVESIEAKDVGRVDLKDGELAPELRALDESGKELKDVAIQLSPKIPSVLKSKGEILIPVSVGKTEVVAAAGARSATFNVEVVKRVSPEALPIENGRRIDMSLEEGRYELVVKLKQPKSLTTRWRGAAFCNATSPAALEHNAKCDLNEGGGVSFDNPNWLDNQDPEIELSGVTLTQIP